MAEKPSFIEVQKSLAGVDYPADREQLIEHARQHGAEEGIVSALEKIPDRTYDGPNTVSKAVAEVS